MKINIRENQVSFDMLKADLEANFPQYSFAVRSKNFLVGKKSSSIGANILLKRSKIMVAGNFPTMGQTMLFMIFVILLGVLIPLIIYLIAFHSKMREFEKEIAAFLQEKYGNTAV